MSETKRVARLEVTAFTKDRGRALTPLQKQLADAFNSNRMYPERIETLKENMKTVFKHINEFQAYQEVLVEEREANSTKAARVEAEAAEALANETAAAEALAVQEQAEADEAKAELDKLKEGEE